ncbi:MAG TPA: 3-hexulose-6-phosphate synthase [Spirochaetia bacterium]|nr:3-hexulose-6-phosphate synthase [Spirochaetia bacterium]
MKLQLALDTESLAAARAVLEATADLIDIAEVGTPLVFREGAAAIRVLKTEFPRLAILADFKIMDAGQEEAGIAFEAGADIVTVLAAAETVTIERACEAARKAGREVMADLIAIVEPLKRAAAAAAAGAHYLCCHTAFDMKATGADPVRELAVLRDAFPGARLAVAGGITPDRMRFLIPHKPEVIVVGGHVTRAVDPRAAIMEIRSAMR